MEYGKRGNTFIRGYAAQYEAISDYRANRAPAISFNEEDRAQQKSEKKR
jgi:hypothetical protein